MSADHRATLEPLAVPVLMYHSISDSATQRFRPFTVSPALFATHVDYLATAGYTCLTTAELARLRQSGGTPAARTVVLTFDDAFRDFGEHAAPVLSAARFRSTLFVPTGFVGGTSRWLVAEGEQRRRLLDWGELSQLSGMGVEIGAHSHSHPQLDLLDRRCAAREISLSKALLEDRLQVSVESFAYPFGYSKASVRHAVAEHGFTSACAVADLVSGPDDDLFAIPRLTVGAGTTTAQLASLLSSPRTRRDDITAWARGAASRALRTARLKKRANAPGSAPPASPLS